MFFKDLGTQRDILKKSGAFYSFGETRLGQGRENAKLFLVEHPEMADDLDRVIRAAVDLPAPAGTAAPHASAAPEDAPAAPDAPADGPSSPDVPEQLRTAAAGG